MGAHLSKIVFKPHEATYVDDNGEMVFFHEDFETGQRAMAMADIIWLKTARGEEIPAISVKPRILTSGFTILVSHTNMEDLGLVASFLSGLANYLGCELFFYEYSGYGLATGKPSEENCYADIDAAYKYLVSNRGIDSQKIILLGRSLGCGPSIDLASRTTVGGLILIAPFTSVMRVKQKCKFTLPLDMFASIDKIDKVQCKVLTIHGMEDQIVPFDHGMEIHDRAPRTMCPLWVQGARHNNIETDYRNEFLPRMKACMNELHVDLLRACLEHNLKGKRPVTPQLFSQGTLVTACSAGEPFQTQSQPQAQSRMQGHLADQGRPQTWGSSATDSLLQEVSQRKEKKSGRRLMSSRESSQAQPKEVSRISSKSGPSLQKTESFRTRHNPFQQLYQKSGLGRRVYSTPDGVSRPLRSDSESSKSVQPGDFLNQSFAFRKRRRRTQKRGRHVLPHSSSHLPSSCSSKRWRSPTVSFNRCKSWSCGEEADLKAFAEEADLKSFAKEADSLSMAISSILREDTSTVIDEGSQPADIFSSDSIFCSSSASVTTTRSQHGLRSDDNRGKNDGELHATLDDFRWRYAVRVDSEDYPDDKKLLRFLRARQFNCEEAIKLASSYRALMAHMDWPRRRKEAQESLRKQFIVAPQAKDSIGSYRIYLKPSKVMSERTPWKDMIPGLFFLVEEATELNTDVQRRGITIVVDMERSDQSDYFRLEGVREFFSAVHKSLPVRVVRMIFVDCSLFLRTKVHLIGLSCMGQPSGKLHFIRRAKLLDSAFAFDIPDICGGEFSTASGVYIRAESRPRVE